MDYRDDMYENDELDTTEAEETAVAGESKAEKFTRLAVPRINKVLHGIESIGKLSSSAYEYSDEQVEKMFSAMETKLAETKAKFSKQPTSNDSFSF